MPYARKKQRRGDISLKKGWRTRNRKKDLDEIDQDLQDENAKKLLNQDIDFDKPGAAQHYCIHCSRYFIDKDSLLSHFRQKTHKRRLKALELEPYTIQESERAAGHGNYTLPKKRKIETRKCNDYDDDDDEKIEVDDHTAAAAAAAGATKVAKSS